MKTPASRLIGQFNKRGLTETPIQYADVADVMMPLSEGKIEKILSELEAKADTVRDPTGWVKIAAKKAGKGGPPVSVGHGKGGPPKSVGHGQPVMVMTAMPQKSPVSKLIGQFNKRSVTAPIQYADVAEVMGQLKENKIAKILSELEEKADTVRDPTAWVKIAAVKAIKNAGPSVLAGSGRTSVGTMSMPQKSAASKLIGQFNKREVTAPIQYKDVAEVMSQLGENKIAKILSELEEKKDSVRDPTAWVKVAAGKAGPPKSQMMVRVVRPMPQTGGSPAKRRRLA
eukprot:TRINITY_DN2280_c0_g1_i6.p1 TRINITY_DN2280_c0_g1~~TRINITY_DN2280_c0_g1_i6.p1  ORF type:complete len:303 (+),score=45.96 TRINITY_DN2280_c0_g1_i6:57-911(+)